MEYVYLGMNMNEQLNSAIRYAKLNWELSEFFRMPEF